MSTATATKNKDTLGVIAGSGRLPAQLVEYCRQNDRPVFVLGFNDTTDPETYAHVPHAIVRIESVGEALEHLRNAGVTELVMAGKVRRPSLIGLRPDKLTAKLLARMGSTFFSGDNALFTSLVSFLEEEGFKIIGAEQVMDELIHMKACLEKSSQRSKILPILPKACELQKRLGSLDIGQAVIVENNYVLGVEAAEGTDAMITAVPTLKMKSAAAYWLKPKNHCRKRV